jgi:hypothetical protein
LTLDPGETSRIRNTGIRHVPVRYGTYWVSLLMFWLSSNFFSGAGRKILTRRWQHCRPTQGDTAVPGGHRGQGGEVPRVPPVDRQHGGRLRPRNKVRHSVARHFRLFRGGYGVKGEMPHFFSCCSAIFPGMEVSVWIK